jgi:hypothetical protein
MSRSSKCGTLLSVHTELLLTNNLELYDRYSTHGRAIAQEIRRRTTSVTNQDQSHTKSYGLYNEKCGSLAGEGDVPPINTATSAMSLCTKCPIFINRLLSKAV